MLRWFGRKKGATKLTPEQQAFFGTPEGRAHLEAYFRTEEGAAELRRSFRQEIDERQPALREALWADACIYSSLLMQPPAFTTRLGFIAEALNLSVTSDAFLPMVLYRVRVRMMVRHVPVLPDLLHRLCMVLGQISIGKGVVMQPGVYIPHGQVVIDGKVDVGAGTVISPWVTLGRNGPALEGPSVADNVFIGTGAKVLGPIKIGAHARIAANAVVLSDVPPHTTVAGAPATVVRSRREEPES